MRETGRKFKEKVSLNVLYRKGLVQAHLLEVTEDQEPSGIQRLFSTIYVHCVC